MCVQNIRNIYRKHSAHTPPRMYWIEYLTKKKSMQISFSILPFDFAISLAWTNMFSCVFFSVHLSGAIFGLKISQFFLFFRLQKHIPSIHKRNFSLRFYTNWDEKFIFYHVLHEIQYICVFNLFEFMHWYVKTFHVWKMKVGTVIFDYTDFICSNERTVWLVSATRLRGSCSVD